MRKQFKEFYHKEQVDLKDLDEKTLVVVDADVLLNVYRFSKESKLKLLKALKVVEKNLWIPYQVGLEFNMDRISIIEERNEYINNIDKQISNTLEEQKIVLLKEIEKTLGNLGVKSKDKDVVKKAMLSNLDEVLSEQIKEWEKTGTDKIHNLIGDVDENCSELIDILDGKVGEQLTQKEMDIIIKDGEERYEVSYPPINEYDDKSCKRYGKVTYDNQYENYIIWENIIQKARKENMSNVVFITDDTKESWVYGTKGKECEPKIELKKELLDIIGANLTILNSNSFLHQAIDEPSNVMDFNPICDIEDLSEGNEEKATNVDLATYKNNQKTNEIERIQENVDDALRTIELRLEGFSHNLAAEVVTSEDEFYMKELVEFQDEYRKNFHYFKKLKHTMEKKITLDNLEFFNDKASTLISRFQELENKAYTAQVLQEKKQDVINR